MARLTDVRAKPGDIVLTRGASPITLWREARFEQSSPAGTAMPGSMGLVVAVAGEGWAYVLWSCPFVCGWSQDGQLRRVKT